jgi:DNA glycosylase AlkZ-like
MTSLDIAHRRLANQHIVQPTFKQPGDVVRWLGAVQAQDYAGAKWALGLRLRGVTDDDIDQAFGAGSILRTHLMRPTWHFVTPLDIGWLLALTGPRVHAVNGYMYRKLELDSAIFKRSNATLAKALRGGKQLTRNELRGVLQKAGIATDGELRMGYLMMRAELDGLVCSGARRGKQFTYALVDERAPRAKTWSGRRL